MTQNKSEVTTREAIAVIYCILQVLILSIFMIFTPGKDNHKKGSTYSPIIQLESDWIPSFFESIKLIGKDSITYKVSDNETEILKKSGNTEFKHVDKNVQLDNNNIEKELAFYISENKDSKYFTIDTKKSTTDIINSVALISRFLPNKEDRREFTKTVTVNYTYNDIHSISYVFSDPSFKDSSTQSNDLDDIKQTLIDSLVDNKFQATFNTIIDRSLNLFSKNTGLEKGQYYRGDIIVTYYKDNGKNLSIVIYSKPDEKTAEVLKSKK